jgi:hypothetical protein
VCGKKKRASMSSLGYPTPGSAIFVSVFLWRLHYISITALAVGGQLRQDHLVSEEIG